MPRLTWSSADMVSARIGTRDIVTARLGLMTCVGEENVDSRELDPGGNKGLRDWMES